MNSETSISLMLLGVSVIFYLFQPKKINYFYGYRTPKSRKSIEHWKVANMMAAKGMIIISLFDAILFFILTDILKYDLLNVFIGLLLLEFGILIYLVEKKLRKINIPQSEENSSE